MRLAGTLRVGCADYRVVEVPESDLGRRASGTADNLMCRISIPAEAPFQRRLEILLHEIVHMGIAGHTDDDDDDKIKEETVALLLGECLAGFLRDNRPYVQAILDKLEENDAGSDTE